MVWTRTGTGAWPNGPVALAVSALLIFGGPALLATAAPGEPIIDLRDPVGDDDGPGTYVYPTSRVYKPGCFDLTRLRIARRLRQVEIAIELAAPVDDPWSSSGWDPPGNGFSLQLAFLFLDTDPGGGRSEGLPGLNVRFAPGSGWDRVVIISPQASARLQAEVKEKIPGLAGAVVLPTKVRASGREIIAWVPLEALGEPRPGWRVQLVMQSNEGYPSKTELMTRRVGARASLHRFGGGRDDDCDPHVIDMLTAPGRGTPAEADSQHTLLLDYACGRPALLPLVEIQGP